jgi:hypothetical protein
MNYGVVRRSFGLELSGGEIEDGEKTEWDKLN